MNANARMRIWLEEATKRRSDGARKGKIRRADRPFLASPSSLRRCVAPSLLFLFLFGCADQATKQNLTAGYTSLDAKQYDDALTHAEEQISKAPTSSGSPAPGSAEALYLKGRAIEQRPKQTTADAQNDLSTARQAYVNALGLSPPPKLEPYIHASLANVCYWQDDYSAALQQWSAVSGKLSDDDSNAYVMYRIGLCQQRMGQFQAADETFAAVEKKKPGSEAAEHAQSHSGARSFAVQLATYATASSAESAMTRLRSEMLNPKRVATPRGQQVISIGPFDTYLHAKQMCNRMVRQYPDAIVIP